MTLNVRVCEPHEAADVANNVFDIFSTHLKHEPLFGSCFFPCFEKSPLQPVIANSSCAE